MALIKNSAIRILTLAALAFVASVFATAQTNPVADIVITPGKRPLRFVVYGDIRFTDPAQVQVAIARNLPPASDPVRRQLLVQRIAKEKPDFVAITGDLVLNGGNLADWQQWDSGSQPFRDAGISIFPTIGNHELYGGNIAASLANYFQRFPHLKQRRWYAVQYGNAYFLMIDSMSDTPGSDEWNWLATWLEHLPADARFVFLAMHHPPITQSSEQIQGGGHSARESEQKLAQLIEQNRRPGTQVVVLAGHVHNYERYIHGGVTYITTGGGGATPYMVARQPTDFYRDPGPTYHFCKFKLDGDKLKFEMVKLELEGDKPHWKVKDKFELRADKPLPDSPVAPASSAVSNH